MTENSEATPAPATLIAPSSTAEDHGTDTTNRGIVLRVVLLIAFFVLANAWFLLQFGVKLGSVFIIELIVGVSAGVRKLLRGPDAKAVDRMIESAFYGLLSTPALVILYALLAAVTLTHSTIVISDAHAKTACILPGSATTCTGAPLLSDDKQATFFEWTTPAGKSYRAR
ncbi:MAG: hypothetical protein QOE82_2224, partial [Thermoanaerobaculia bacterium]|nr:hypothetical protein [Thermoanaerobaculia bacterium]